MDYRSFFISKNIEIQEGLTQEELRHAEETYGIVFPNEFRRMLEQAVPVTKPFYDWRDYSELNIELIRRMLAWPFDTLNDEVDRVNWSNRWGDPPKDKTERESIIRQKLSNAPKMIPVFAHRFIPMCEGESHPIFSIYGADIICYGSCIDEYLQIEFYEKEQTQIEWSKIKQIPFWSEVM